MSRQIELQTARLLLRGAVEGDAAYLHDTFKNAEAMRYWSELPHQDLHRTQEWVAGMMKGEFNGVSDFVICLKPGMQPIGKMGVWSGDEIGFILDPSHWHQGLAVEGLNTMIPYLFGERKLDSISADIDPRNVASIGLLKKFGFEEEKYEKKTFQIGDEWVDSLYLRLTKERWKSHSLR